MELEKPKNSEPNNLSTKLSSPQEISIADFSYELLEEKIAQFPLKIRDQSKLLVYRGRNIQSEEFSNLNLFLPEKSLLVFNNSKVIQARLLFKTSSGAQVEIFCLEPHFNENTFEDGKADWKCFVGKAKKWKDPVLSNEVIYEGKSVILTAKQLFTEKDYFVIRFEWKPIELEFDAILGIMGFLPLPPYMNRDATEEDKKRYQTIYAKYDGSVAAPTAGLHFTDNVFEKLATKNIESAFVTLHVGAGTFKPVKSKTMADHPMHDERVVVSKQTIELLLTHFENITAVGTTSMRTLESLYWLGVKLATLEDTINNQFIIEQWFPYENQEIQALDPKIALQSILKYLENKNLEQISFRTFILIAPGYPFKIVNRLITNFHQPESTLILLVAAFIGEDWKKVYQFALNQDYRFLSYGDSSLLFRNEPNQ